MAQISVPFTYKQGIKKGLKLNRIILPPFSNYQSLRYMSERKNFNHIQFYIGLYVKIDIMLGQDNEQNRVKMAPVGCFDFSQNICQ